MLLLDLKICNFRSFYGYQHIAFAHNTDSPVTLIFGENGAGKTNLLNALYWCLTGKFTPRLTNPELLHNRAARDEDREAECYVDLVFSHETKKYQAIRTVTGRNQDRFAVYHVVDEVPKPVPHPQRFIERIIPSNLSRWFFFDSEAIGSLELSGSEEFRKSLRRVLGFELVDVLVEDLQSCLSKRQRNLANITSSKELGDIQGRIENIEHVLPDQREKAAELDRELSALDAQIARVESQLRGLPKSKPLQERRDRLDGQRKLRIAARLEAQERSVRFLGDTAPSILARSLAVEFGKDLHQKENTGRLPAPYSEQLVEDILRDGLCVCGRPVTAGSTESKKIRALLKTASTTAFNQRTRAIQLLLKQIDGIHAGYRTEEARLAKSIADIDAQIVDTDEELKEIRLQLQAIDEDVIRSLEDERAKANAKHRTLFSQHSIITNNISENERKLADLQLRYDNASKRVGHGDAVRKEMDKIKQLSEYIALTLKTQEQRALKILQHELNRVLSEFLTKHFVARINPKTYEVDMLDAQDRQVGRSTGEGQVLKFAFITTVVSLAGRKTQEKIDFLAEPTVAPLVLDAPFTTLDSDYQGSVAENLAVHSTQLVMMLLSAAWSPPVVKALEGRVGKRYVLISKQAGARGNKPIKTMAWRGKVLALNVYGAERDETVVLELK